MWKHGFIRGVRGHAHSYLALWRETEQTSKQQLEHNLMVSHVQPYRGHYAYTSDCIFDGNRRQK